MKAFILGLFMAVSVAANDVTPVGIAHSNDGAQSLVLQDVRGECPEGTKRGYLVIPSQALIWQGCYMIERGNVMFVDEDGDVLIIPVRNFKWAKEPKVL